MKITFSDISKRISRMNATSRSFSVNMRECKIYTDKNVFCKNNAILAINNMFSLAEDSNEAFDKALDIFDEACNSLNKSEIKTICNILIENVDKVRDQTQLANSLKYRLAVLKKKPITKLSNTFEKLSDKMSNMTNKLSKPISNRAGIANTTQAGDSDNNQSDDQSVPTPDENEETKQEAYNRILSRCMIIKECDRILKNYNNISKRFNIDKIVDEISCDNDIYEACYNIAACIDTYGGSFKSKYNSALETVSYAFDKHFINYPKNKIIEAVTDYFIFSGDLTESGFDDVKQIIGMSILFEQSDFISLGWMFGQQPEILKEEIEYINSYGINPDYIIEEKATNELKKELKAFKKDAKQSTKQFIKDAKEGRPDEKDKEELDSMMTDFRKKCTKDPKNKANIFTFKSIITKMFTKSPEQVVLELPNMLSLIRIVFVTGLIAINPIIALVGFITDQLISNHISRKQAEKVIKAYKKEISSVEKKVEKAKDGHSKDRLESYLKELKEDLEKLETYERNLYSEKENDERDEARWASEYSNSDSDDLDDDFNFDFDFEEAASIICISKYMERIHENLLDDSVEGIVYNNIFKLDNDSIDALTDFSITVPVILEKEKLKEALLLERNKVRNAGNSVKNYVRISCLNDNIRKLENSVYSYYNSYTSAKDAMMYLSCVNEISKMKSDNYIMEMDFTNTIKLAISNLKKGAVKLSDKDKQLSTSIDVAANNVSKGLERAVMNGNREAVLRGSIIPSASKCIKIALVTGAAWAVSPAVAIIGAIGAFVCSKKMQAKERQLVLDDIEIELKMCERYMRQAEDENDMKKIRQIEIMQRNLERQRQRIKYKMTVIYNQKTPEVGTHDDD